MTLTQIRSSMDALQERCLHQRQALSGLEVTAKEPPELCAICQKEMQVQKSYTHQGRTLAHGRFAVSETFWVCGDGCRYPSGGKVVQRSPSVAQILMPRSSIGYDVMVTVGLQRYLHHRQREEIQNDLSAQYGVYLSTGTISQLSVRFTAYLARLHQAKAGQLKAVLDQDGGWPLHLDATGESGRGTLLVVMAGWRKWVLGAWKIATEKQELIAPCLQAVTRQFGFPCAVMRDLGRAVIPAAAALAEAADHPIPVLACHQHFLSDIGSDLLESLHAELRGLFRRFKILPQLRGLVRDLGCQIGDRIDEARPEILQWQACNETDHRLPAGQNGLAVVRAVSQWVLDYAADGSGLDFPYDRPYLDLYDRCFSALRAADAFLRHLPDATVGKYASRLQRILVTIASEVPFSQVAQQLLRRANLFDSLRKQLRLFSKLPEGESPEDIKAMRRQFEKWTDNLKESRPSRGPGKNIRAVINTILKHIEVHGANLWGQVITLPDGSLRLTARTNALLENFFGEMKHAERRRSGRKNLTSDLEHLPAEAALAYNLNQPDYVSVVCGSLELLPQVFAQMDLQSRSEAQNGLAPAVDLDLKRSLVLSTASMSTVDKRIVRRENMSRRIYLAAGSRAPKIGY